MCITAVLIKRVLLISLSGKIEMAPGAQHILPFWISMQHSGISIQNKVSLETFLAATWFADGLIGGYYGM